MKIWFRPYKRRCDGVVILFANNDRKVSMTILENGLGKSFSNMTGGEQKLTENLKTALRLMKGMRAEPDFDAHTEDKTVLGDGFGTLYITDTANVGGINTGSDGAFLHFEGRLIHLSQSVGV